MITHFENYDINKNPFDNMFTEPEPQDKMNVHGIERGVMKVYNIKTWKYLLRENEMIVGKIIGYENGKGKYSDMVGKLLLKTKNGEIVKVGSGLTDSMRKSPPPIGSIVTFKYMGFTDSGKHRHPTFLRMYEKI